MLTSLRRKGATYLRLGPRNLWRVALYRIGLKTGLHPVLKLSGGIVAGPFFRAAQASPEAAIAPSGWQDQGLLFSYHPLEIGSNPPDWHANPFDPTRRAPQDLPWHRIPDFNPELGDVKNLWELSRFDWLLAMAARAAKGDQAELARLNLWLGDWAEKNPPYLGVNWKCGQEASIRVMHLCLAAKILGQEQAPLPGLRALLELHLRRIAPSMGYAIGQANNHGSSEATALFIGGLMLGGSEGQAWSAQGRRWLEDRARNLILPDGTFSQYSTNYHRLMLDSYALAEVWRRSANAPAFSAQLHDRLRAALHWLFAVTCPESGDAPNLGANDGARLIPLSDSDYRDYRPTVQLGAVLFAQARAYGPGPWDQPLIWLGCPLPEAQLPEPRSESFDAGGLHVLRQGAVRTYLRYPRFRFRPSQADALHLDLWIGAQNILRDGGSYSYASPKGVELAGTSAHCTICFDGADQMPKLGRFLYGDWLSTIGLRKISQSGAAEIEAAAGYRDAKGRSHLRALTLSPERLRIQDQIAGPFKEAILRFRLAPGDWQLEGQSLHGAGLRFHFQAEAPLEITLTEGQESRHYLTLTPIPQVEIRLSRPGAVITDIHF